VFLFATLPSVRGVHKEAIEESRRLAAEFQNYIVASRSLRKAFLSIKGIYYQADIRGQLVTWLVPYQFNQEIPRDVDFRVMATFLEFYRALLGFVNYKLYSDLNLLYPPALDARMEESGAGLLNAYTLQNKDGQGLDIVMSTNDTDMDPEEKKRQKV
jgi:pescadillo protein